MFPSQPRKIDRSASAHKLRHPAPASNLQCHSYVYCLPRLWNMLPLNYEATPSSIKFQIHSHLIPHAQIIIIFHFSCYCNSIYARGQHQSIFGCIKSCNTLLVVLSMYIFKSVLAVFRDELIILVICTAVVSTCVRGATTNLINL